MRYRSVFAVCLALGLADAAFAQTPPPASTIFDRFDVQSATIATRYRFIENSSEAVTSNHVQFKDTFRLRVKLLEDGRVTSRSAIRGAVTEDTAAEGAAPECAGAAAETGTATDLAGAAASGATGRRGRALHSPFARAKEDAIARFEHAYLAALLEGCAGNISLAARRAGLPRHHVRRLLRKRGLYALGLGARSPAAAVETVTVDEPV